MPPTKKTDKTIEQPCQQCGKIFISWKLKNQSYCSKLCAYRSKTRSEKLKKSTTKQWQNPETREKTLAGIKRRSESEEWRSAPHFQKGENHPRYKGNRAARRKGYARYEYKKWRIDVFSRDNYTCQRCGKRGGRLTAHHIKEWAKYPSLRYEVFNGMTVCHKCHDIIHGVIPTPKTRKCLNCGLPFNVNKNARKFCSISCSSTHQNIKKRRLAKICAYCGRTFLPKKASIKHCCQRCGANNSR